MNSLWDIRIFLGLVPKESHCTTYVVEPKIRHYLRLEIKKGFPQNS